MIYVHATFEFFGVVWTGTWVIRVVWGLFTKHKSRQDYIWAAEKLGESQR